jgi:DNA repair protein RadC
MKKQIQGRAATYGLAALSDNELLSLLGVKVDSADFWGSSTHKAMKELMRRESAKDEIIVNSSKIAADYFNFLSDLDHEQFWAVFLNNRNKIISSAFISKGDETGTVVSIKEILKQSIQLKAKGIIICHNHPSGVNKPSDADVKLTRKLKDAATLIDSRVLDHVIIAGNSYFSFADEGLI